MPCLSRLHSTFCLALSDTSWLHAHPWLSASLLWLPLAGLYTECAGSLAVCLLCNIDVVSVAVCPIHHKCSDSVSVCLLCITGVWSVMLIKNMASHPLVCVSACFYVTSRILTLTGAWSVLACSPDSTQLYLEMYMCHLDKTYPI